MTASMSWRLKASKRAARFSGVSVRVISVAPRWCGGKPPPAPEPRRVPASWLVAVGLGGVGSWRGRLHLALPGDQHPLEVADQQVEGEGEGADHDNAHDDGGAVEELRGVQH